MSDRDRAGRVSSPRSPARHRPTLHTVAAAAGVSHQTVANVLNFPDRVAADTRERVEQAIDELGYRPHQSARALARQETRLVAFHIGDGRHHESSLIDPFLRELVRIGKTHGYGVVVDLAADGDGGQIASYRELRARGAVDGVVIPQTHVGDRRPDWLMDQGVPVVAFGRPWSAPQARHSWVDVDGGHGMRLVAEHLATAGHRRFAYLGPSRDGGMEDDRLDGLLAGLAGYGIGADAVAQLPAADPGQLDRALAELIDRHRPTALVCRDDVYAFEALQIAKEFGLGIGHDLAVTGFDDSELAERCRPQLTSVHQPIGLAASLIWESLLDQLGSRQRQPMQRLIPPSLTIRGSSAPGARAGTAAQHSTAP